MNVLIYGLYDPRTPTEIRYVGWTKNLDTRMKLHLRSKKKKRLKVNDWLDELAKNGVCPGAVVFYSVEWRFRYDAETAQIKLLDREHRLLNVTKNTRYPPPQALAAWKAKLANGFMPKHSAKVICLANLKQWPSLRKCANYFGVTPTYIINRIRGRIPFRGHLLCYANNQAQISDFRIPPGNKKKVTCLSSGVAFESISSAARSVDRSPAEIRDAIARKIKSGGCFWAYYGTFSSVQEYLKDKPPFTCPVVRADTGQQFDSLRAAAKSVGVTHQSLRKALSKNRPCRGVLFKAA